MLLLVGYRPEYVHAWGSKTYYRQLRLDVLPAATADELLDSLVGPDAGLSSLKRLLIERTEGNPFFLEEAVRALAETKMFVGERGAYRLAGVVQNLQLPTTAQAILAARIDRLAPEDKRLLQAASVVGKDVPFALLQAIGDEPDEQLRSGLSRLQAAEFLYEVQLFPDLEYTFKHALTHEVAYGSILGDRRRALHAALVTAYEKVYADRLTEHVEHLAHHAMRGELREKAVQYHRQAGLRAAARSALQDARVWLETALDTLEDLPESRATLEQAFDVRLEMRPVLFQLTEERRALERVLEAQALAERLNDDHRRGLIYSLMTSHHSSSAPREALAVGARALEVAGRLGDLRLRICTTSYLAQAHYWLGDYEKVVQLATDNLAVLPAAWVYEFLGASIPASVMDRNWLVQSLAHHGRFAQAAQHATEAIRLADATHHTNTLAHAHYGAGLLHLLQGDWTNARTFIEHPITAYRAGNVVMVRRTAICSSAWVLAQLGEEREAQSRLREGELLIERYAATGVVGYRSWTIYSLGRACLLLGRLDEAQGLGARAIESHPEHAGVAAYSLHLLGDIATHPDRFDAECGEAYYRKAFALAELRVMRPLVAHCHLGLGKLYRRAGKREQAHEHLTAATTMYREMGMTYWLEQADVEMRLQA